MPWLKFRARNFRHFGGWRLHSSFPAPSRRSRGCLGAAKGAGCAISVLVLDLLTTRISCSDSEHSLEGAVAKRFQANLFAAYG
jgi:hypothetical protein